jgi:hypothetical protein
MPNVSEEGLAAFLELHNKTYRETADSLLPADYRGELVRYRLLSGRTIGYVSTQIGTAFEYEPGEQEIVTRRSSGPVDTLLLGAPFRLPERDPTILGLKGVGPVTMERVGLRNFSHLVEFIGAEASLRMVDCNLQFDVPRWERKIAYADCTLSAP